MTEKLEQLIIEACSKYMNGPTFSSSGIALECLYENVDGVRYGWSFSLIDDSEDVEFYDYLYELTDIIAMIPKDFNFTTEVKKDILKYIKGLPWDNFMTEEGSEKDFISDDITDTDYYSLGSMFWNKLQWTIEGCNYPEAVRLATDICDVIVPVLDELELIVNDNA